MKIQYHRSWVCPGSSIAGLFVAAAFLPAAVNATSLSLAPATQDIGVGGSFELSLRIAGLGDHAAPSLGAFDLDVTFNSALVQFDSVSFGDPLLGDQLGPVTPSATRSTLSVGSLNLFSVSLDDPADVDSAQPSEFILATLHFTALAQGSSSFDLVNIIFGDANGDRLALDETQNAGVNIMSQAVPEGATGWAGAMCLGALVVGHRQLSRRQTVSQHRRRNSLL
jgi:hypothetical protein